MGIEVPHDDGIILMGAEQGVEVGPVPCWAAGDWGDVDVDDVELNVINYEGDSLVLNDGVTREQLVGGQGGERDRVMDEGDETASSTVAGAVAAVGVVVWKVSVWGGIRELGFLYARNKNFPAVQQGPKLTAAMLDAVAVKLEEGAPTACEGTCTVGWGALRLEPEGGSEQKWRRERDEHYVE